MVGAPPPRAASEQGALAGIVTFSPGRHCPSSASRELKKNRSET